MFIPVGFYLIAGSLGLLQAVAVAYSYCRLILRSGWPMINFELRRILGTAAEAMILEHRTAAAAELRRLWVGVAAIRTMHCWHDPPASVPLPLSPLPR